MNFQLFLDNTYTVAGRVVDPIAGSVTRHGETFHIRRKELELLAILASHNNKLVTRDEFIEIAWNGNSIVGDQGLTRAMAYLRKTLGDNDSQNPLIRTIPRKGYQLSSKIDIKYESSHNFLAVGEKVIDRPEWVLIKLVGKNKYIESWLAKSSKDQTERIFRFCLNEQHLQSLKHELNVLRFFRRSLNDRSDINTIVNWRLDEPPYYLELPSTTHGNIKSWLYSDAGAASSVKDRIRMMHKVAVALSAVHGINKTHRNITHDSIYIDLKDHIFHAKLGEFGFNNVYEYGHSDAINADQNDENIFTFSGIRADAIYLSPELKRNEKFETTSDIYALGVLLYQCVIGTIPAPLKTNWAAKVNHKALEDLIADCIDTDKNNRPSAQEVADELLLIFSEVEEPKKAQELNSPINQANDTKTKPSSLLKIGKYYLIEKIGEGGMGEIYLAEQRQPIARTVALKLIKAGANSEDIVTRFESERQALALMNHVNVASVYEFGKSDDGRLYFSMEYVPGNSIIKYCDELKLDIKSRVALFLQVCDGVMHAHQKGVIHRDLNPSNILIKRQVNDSPLVKIIDFGVAKSLQTKLIERTLFTQHGLFVGTPQYASPEQMRGNQDTVDTRSDIYSLGVILYEMLFGITPIDKEVFLKLSPTELAIQFYNSDAPFPVSRFNKLKERKRAEISQNRSISVNDFINELEHEATWVVMKCLEVNPDSRYTSVIELKNDLSNWLQYLPVKAKKTGILYRSRKFTQRNRSAVIASVIFFSLMVAMFVVAVNGYYQAKLSAKETELVAQFQLEKLKNIDPTAMGIRLHQQVTELVANQTLEEPKKVSEIKPDNKPIIPFNIAQFITIAQSQLDEILFDPSLKAITDEYADYPAVKIRLLQTLADMSLGLSKPERSFNLQQMAYVESKRFYGEEHISTYLAQIKFAFLRSQSGQVEAAADEASVALDGIINHLGIYDEKTIDAQIIMSQVLIEYSQAEQAEQILLSALSNSSKYLGQNHPKSIEIYLSLGTLYRKSNNLTEAKIYATKALEKSLMIYGESDSKTIAAKRNMALFYEITGENELALKLLQEAIVTLTHIYGNFHPRILDTKKAIAQVFASQGLFEEAEKIDRDILKDTGVMYGVNHTMYYQQMINYGISLVPFNQFEAANAYFDDGISGLNSLYSADHVYVVKANHSIAWSYVQQQRYVEAEQLLNAVIANYEKLYGLINSHTMNAKSIMANVYLETGKLDEADMLYDQIIDFWSSEAGVNSPYAIQAVMSKAFVLFQKNESDLAEAILSNVITEAEESEDLKYLKYLAMLDLSKIYFSKNEAENGHDYLNQSLQGLLLMFGENNPFTQQAQDYYNEVNDIKSSELEQFESN